MDPSLLATKLFAPPPRVPAVERAELTRRLNAGLIQGQAFTRRLSLISAPPGFGKTSLVSQWLAALPLDRAWLSLDAGDDDPGRFLGYLVAALQTADPLLGVWVVKALQVPQPPSIESLLTRLVNDLAGRSEPLVLVLDDYHLVVSPSVDEVLAFLIERLPPSLHLVVVTREDPVLPLGRYRARGQMAELRAKDLRFSRAEVAVFFASVAGLDLCEDELGSIEARTEGWPAGLQFAALALQGSLSVDERRGFLASFTGSHRFVLDYLVEEVLRGLPETVLSFLLATSQLGRFCGPLCDAVLGYEAGRGAQELEALERANLFLLPLDGERRFYRYHHLFAELLTQRLATSRPSSCPEPALIHERASLWFEKEGFLVEAFRHAAAAGDAARAEALIEDGRMPTHARGAMMEVLGWLVALPRAVKDGRPSLWVKSATLSLLLGLTAGVEERLEAAEAALRGREETERLLFGQMETARATLAVSQYRVEEVKLHARRALELLEGLDSSFRLAALWDLGIAQQNSGDSVGARRVFTEVFAKSRAGGAVFFQVLSALGLGELEEEDNGLFAAAETFRQVLELSGDHPLPSVCEAQLGLARIHYEWNELELAEAYGREGLALARQYDSSVDRFLPCELFLAALDLARGRPEQAEKRLVLAEEEAHKRGFARRIPEIRAAQALLQLRTGGCPETAGLPPPLVIRILLARGEAETASSLLETWAAGPGDRADEGLKALVLRALVEDARGNRGRALAAAREALSLAEAGGFIRLFVDEGEPMRLLIRELREGGSLPEYGSRIIAAFPLSPAAAAPKGREVLTGRESEVLLHLAAGLSNQAIADRLFVSPHTVKIHVRNIFAKLGATSRTAAAAKARALGLLS